MVAHGDASSQPLAYMPLIIEKSFTVMSAEEQQWYNVVRGWLITNIDFNEPFLDEISLRSDIRQMLSNLGWIRFHKAVITYNLDIATEVASTMQLGRGKDGSDALTFHVQDSEHMITVDGLAMLLGFDHGTDVVEVVSK